ncbi:protein of unknown function [Pseudodesulfovibrio profundus]|uniref:Uncharacterized protein n=1 Tax=Pseudodesulfovibrio profundus TaxID=57320 RepID=A0A2C8FBS9_9BACT|nr:hypothetical protein [Pseudodesulfovibrio profundus]SOB60098.1 protein of unknown function [Pseudodesulfovibrio profundus]|tara:strand:+ start:4927 stop:5076 length:150 start_codon:yes stop_codon:yes gene_type:complete
MTFKRGINSKYKSKDFLQRGLRSMFPNYKEASNEDQAPPVDTEKKQKQR